MHFLKVRIGTLLFIVLLILILANSPLSEPSRIRIRANGTFVVLVILAVHILLTNRKVPPESSAIESQTEPETEAQQQPEESTAEQRSRHIPVKSQRIAWAQFLLVYYADPTNDGKPLRRRDYHFDHRIPWSRGGTHDPENIQVLPREENLKKGAKMPEEWKRN